MKMKTSQTITLLAALAVAGGCSSGRTADSLAAGETAVVHLALKDDGSLEATAVEVEEDEGDGIDCEQEGEHEGENEGCDATTTPRADMIVGRVDAASSDALTVLGIRIDAPVASAAPTAKTFWFRGAYVGASQFTGEMVRASPAEHLRVMGTITKVSRTDGALTIEVFDRSIRVEGALPLTTVKSLEEAAETDVECDQSGENVGENAGC